MTPADRALAAWLRARRRAEAAEALAGEGPDEGARRLAGRLRAEAVELLAGLRRRVHDGDPFTDPAAARWAEAELRARRARRDLALGGARAEDDSARAAAIAASLLSEIAAGGGLDEDAALMATVP